MDTELTNQDRNGSGQVSAGNAPSATPAVSTVNAVVPRVGIVVIGRNEGDRLKRCLASILNRVLARYPSGSIPVVYVDSGSTDGSLDSARTLGMHAIALDAAQPFTMARGRNTGFEWLVQTYAELEYVQFIDGDCEIVEGWLASAIAALEANPDLAVVCGRRRERYPHASIYNQLADMEWDTPIGATKACGGDALMRASVLQEAGGYNGKLICGEEPDLCFRLRQRGWQIERLNCDMTLHDADMHRFSQWWQRSLRGGWAVAEGAAMHGGSEERYNVVQRRSGWLWGATIPLIALGVAMATSGISILLGSLGYAVLGYRIYRHRLERGDDCQLARLYAYFCVLSKPAQALGQLKYWLVRWRGSPAHLIEYKSSG